ncbi:hypothetical protein F2Q70_00005753 [Brassica cretica]|uniref:Uncharacterized protein n=1 Tax=Brassica cretica TaxID=69181 RepID=A0A8S9IV71_BRACR|nr:hypothetical protein F2Q70_00005753 [Brassica cretica]
MDVKNNLICDEPEEIPSPKFIDCLKSSSTPWRSPIRHGSMMMMPSTPLAWPLIQLNSLSKKTMMTSSKFVILAEIQHYEVLSLDLICFVDLDGDDGSGRRCRIWMETADLDGDGGSGRRRFAKEIDREREREMS